MKLLEKLKFKLGIWLICNKTMTATSKALSNKVVETRCIHCGKNPFFRNSKSK